MSTKTDELKISQTIIDSINELDEFGDKNWGIIVFNNNYNTFTEVINILVKAIECSPEKAEAFASEIHYRGLAIVYCSHYKSDCEKRANIITTIGIKVAVEKLTEYKF